MGRRVSAADLENRLQQVRLARGLSQVQLAARAGITRQAVKAIEAGKYTPNTAVALQLAGALGCRVEDIFRVQSALPEVAVRYAGEASEAGDRLAVARVRQSTVAYPLSGTRWLSETLTPADGIAREGETVELLASPEDLDRTAVLLGCDPSLSVLSHAVARSLPGVRLLVLHSSSQSALDSLAVGEAHIAGTHLPESEGEENVRQAKRALGKGGGLVVTYAAWEQGFIVAAGNPLSLRGIEDLGRPVRLVNREEGSGSRKLLDRLLIQAGLRPSGITGYTFEAPSHAAVARAVASGTADAGIGLEVAARAFGLSFVPLAEVRFDLVIPAEHVRHPAVQVMLEVLQSRRLRADLAALPGYHVARSGDTVLEIKAA